VGAAIVFWENYGVSDHCLKWRGTWKTCFAAKRTLGKRISDHGGESLSSVLSRWRFSLLKKNTEIRALLLSLEKIRSDHRHRNAFIGNFVAL
jgi:hypothetical protein